MSGPKERPNPRDIVVTTRSGAKLRLEPAGFDCEGNQLWRQIGSGFGNV